MWDVCCTTARSVIDRVRAIDALVRPSDIRASTCCWRGVSRSSASWCPLARATLRLTTSGGRAGPRGGGRAVGGGRPVAPQWVAPGAGDHEAHGLGVEDGAAGSDAAEVVDERVDVGDPLLEEVPGARGAAGGGPAA